MFIISLRVLPWLFCLRSPRSKSRCEPGWAFIWRLWGRIYFQTPGCWQNSILGVVGLRSPCSFWLLARAGLCSSGPPTHGLLCLQSQQCHKEFFSTLWTTLTSSSTARWRELSAVLFVIRLNWYGWSPFAYHIPCHQSDIHHTGSLHTHRGRDHQRMKATGSHLRTSPTIDGWIHTKSETKTQWFRITV